MSPNPVDEVSLIDLLDSAFSFDAFFHIVFLNFVMSAIVYPLSNI